MKLDGFEVNNGDSLFDLTPRRGWGRVLKVYSDSVEVSFPRGNITFNSLGRQSGTGVRTLFWHQPLIIAPPKYKDTWAKKVDFLVKADELADSIK